MKHILHSRFLTAGLIAILMAASTLLVFADTPAGSSNINQLEVNQAEIAENGEDGSPAEFNQPVLSALSLEINAVQPQI